MKPRSDVTTRLFGYETMGGVRADLWRRPWLRPMLSAQAAADLDAEQADWSSTKREFTHEDVLRGRWEKHEDHGRSFLVTFRPDGTLTKSALDSPTTNLTGRWTVDDGYLLITVDHSFLQFIANRLGDTHSGVEVVEDDEEYVYVRLIQRL